MDPPEKVTFIFVHKSTKYRIKMKFGQKFEKTMKFAIEQFKLKELGVVRFFHKKTNKELFENDSPASAKLDDLDTIVVSVTPYITVVKSEPNCEENQSPTNAMNTDQQFLDPSLSNNMPIATNYPAQDSQSTEQLNSQSEQHTRNGDETMTSIDSVQISASELHAVSLASVDDSMIMDQMDSIFGIERQSKDSTTHLEQNVISSSDSHVVTPFNDENLKRMRDDDNYSSELPAKMMKIMSLSDPIESDKRFDDIERFLDDLATSTQNEVDAFYESEIGPLKERIKQYESQCEKLKLALLQSESDSRYCNAELQRVRNEIEELKFKHAKEMKSNQQEPKVKIEQTVMEAEFERRVKFRIDQLEQRHREALAEQQQMTQAALSQLDELKRTYTAEKEHCEQNCTEWKNKYENLLSEHDAKMLEKEQTLVNQQSAAQSEIAHLKSLHESQLACWEKKYSELKDSHDKIANKENTAELLKRDESIASHIAEVRKSHERIIEYQKHYNALKQNYEALSNKYNKDVAHLNSVIVNRTAQFQSQIKNTKAESDKQINQLQYERNDFINKWKSQEQQLRSYIETLKHDCDNRISQMRQQILTQVQNQVRVPIPTPSPATTPQPSETTATPPPTNASNVPKRERKCMQCGSSCRQVTTITYCNPICKNEYFKQQCLEMEPIQTDV